MLYKESLIGGKKKVGSWGIEANVGGVGKGGEGNLLVEVVTVNCKL